MSALGLFLAGLMDCPKLGGSITCHKILPATPAEFGSNRLPWSRALTDLLAERGIRLYTHQTLATDHIRAGHSIVAATPTASGKSLIYNLPVLEQHLRDAEAKALYLFPLKALAQDQLATFRKLCASWPEAARPLAAIYDGDTSDYQRRKIRQDPPAAVITNPEMLHLAILPYHHNWSAFLANLTHIVVDEAHTYRGIFGSHMAQVFHRLNRVAAHYGADPTYIFCTATLGNPAELAGNLMGKGVEPVLIDKSGAPRGKRHFFFINPESASSTCAIELLKRALAHNLRVIVYCQSRRMTELISLWAGSRSGEWQGKIAAYRAGYLPEERRDIEARMASGKLMAVVSTSALELGIDIGGLDVCILVGYPGTISQTLQRGGRVGRAGQESCVLLVAGEDALDQYFVRHPEDFFARPAEKATVNPGNETILKRHLECAAAELALTAGEAWLSEPSCQKAVAELTASGLLVRTATGNQWLAQRKRPQHDVDLRGSGAAFSLESKAGQVIGLMDGCRVWKETHPGAIYLHRGQSWLVREVDSGRRRILLESAKVGWFTRARSRKETVILEEKARQDLGRCAVFRGRLRIAEQVTGYERRATQGSKLLNVVPLEAPLQIFETDGIWFTIPDNIRQQLEGEFIHFMGSIHALEHAMIGLLPLEVMADRNDFGGISTPLHPQLGLPAVFIYDAMPGGAGLADAAFAHGHRMLEATFRAIADCPCEDGCPSCIQSPKCGAGNRPLSKIGVIRLLQEVLEGGGEGAEICGNLQISPAPDPALPEHSPPEFNQNMTTQSDQELAREARQINVSAITPGHYVVFDVETRLSAQEVGGWARADKMGVSIAVLYDSLTDEYFSYGQDELPQMLAKMAAADLVIGFNSLRFDYKVLQPFAGSTLKLAELPSLDLLQRVYAKLNYRVSLDNLGKATFNIGKSGTGLEALKWWKEGKIQAIADYCRRDVELTRDLYLFGLKEKYLLYSNKAGARVRVPVDFG